MRAENGDTGPRVPIDRTASPQGASVARLIASGYEVAAYDTWQPGSADSLQHVGHVVLTRGTTYTPSGWDYLLSLITLGLWVLVIGVKAGTRRRSVVGVAPDGSVCQLGGPEAPAWALAVAFLALGALGLLVATIFSPMVAAVAVPVAIALLGRVAE